MEPLNGKGGESNRCPANLLTTVKQWRELATTWQIETARVDCDEQYNEL